MWRDRNTALFRAMHFAHNASYFVSSPAIRGSSFTKVVVGVTIFGDVLLLSKNNPYYSHWTGGRGVECHTYPYSPTS